MRRMLVLTVMPIFFFLLTKGQTDLSNILNTRDSLLFDAVLHQCEAKKAAEFFSEDFEFYQDKGNGQAVQSTSRKEFLDRIAERCAAKQNSLFVRRELIKGSAMAEPLGQNEALQTCIQRFYVRQGDSPEQMVEESHFIRTWILKNGQWKIRRELDFQIINPSPQDAASHADPLFREVIVADSTLFDAYNRKDIELMKKIFALDLEFYHDKGGISHYQDNIQNFEQKFKDPSFYSRREVDPSTLQVFPLNNYGAVEIGVHRFYSMDQGKETLTATANFINLWHLEEGKWKLSRVVSYDHH